MEENLRKKAFFGVIWSYIGKFSSQILSIIPAMILARLLGPEQYGLIAMSAIFTGIAYQLADGGFGNALVQKKDADNVDFSTVFFFNIGICSVIYIVIFFCAPFISAFFHEPLLTDIVRVSSLGIVFLAFGQIQTIIFKKEIDYKRQTIVNLTCQILSVIVAIILAYDGWGIWALVVQGLMQTLSSTILNWFISKWRPNACFSLFRLKKLFNYGSKTLASSMIDYGFNKLYDIIIGRVYTPVSLGLYNRAYSTADLFKSTFFSVFSGVTFPIFVKMQDDNERLCINIRKFMIIISMIIFSVMMSLIVLADPLFLFMYSDKWNGAIPLFKIACIVAMLTPVVSILESIILAKGHSGKFLLISIVRKVFVVLVVVIAWKYGIVWMMFGQVFVCICEILLYTHFTKKLVGYSITNLIRDILPYLIIGIITVIPIACIDYVLGNFILSPHDPIISSLIRLLCGAFVCLISFTLTNRVIKTDAYIELIQFIQDAVGEKRILNYLKISK